MKIEIINLEETPSTNSWIRQNSHLLKKDELLGVYANKQPAGRGKGARVWISEEDDLKASIAYLLNSEIDPYLETIKLAKALIQLLEQKGVTGTIKWPNDVLVEGKKICGILCEVLALPNQQKALVIGIGVNLNMKLKTLETIDQPATSVAVLTGKKEPVLPFFKSLVENYLNQE